MQTIFFARSVKRLLATLLVLFAGATANAQPIAYKGMDSNPRLNEAESAYLQGLFPSAVFSFHDKHVGFKFLDVDTTNNTASLYHVTKYHYFTRYDNGQHAYAWRLYMLNSAERRKTNGYEAVVLFTEKRFEKKLEKVTGSNIIRYFHLSYPEIPDDAGSDNNPVLNKANAAFFRALYRGAVPAGFDFEEKKIAILDTHDDPAHPQPVSIGAYVARVRESLLLHEQYYGDVFYLLDAAQKKQSGGYDIIIQPGTKKDVSPDELVRFLGATNGGN